MIHNEPNIYVSKDIPFSEIQRDVVYKADSMGLNCYEGPGGDNVVTSGSAALSYCTYLENRLIRLEQELKNKGVL